MILSVFLWASWSSVYLLWRNVYLYLPIHFLNWGAWFFLILRGMACFHILKINPLSAASFVNIFSHSEDDLFILFIISFAVQRLLSLIRSHLFIFIFIILGSRLKKILLWFMSKSVVFMFSSESFIVSSHTFRSLIHFEFIFVFC